MKKIHRLSPYTVRYDHFYNRIEIPSIYKFPPLIGVGKICGKHQTDEWIFLKNHFIKTQISTTHNSEHVTHISFPVTHISLLVTHIPVTHISLPVAHILLPATTHSLLPVTHISLPVTSSYLTSCHLYLTSKSLTSHFLSTQGMLCLAYQKSALFLRVRQKNRDEGQEGRWCRMLSGQTI